MGDFRLRVFYVVAREGSFSRAAAELHLSQPAVSLQIKALEEEYGQRLLDRTARGARLTAAGERLYRQARRILQLYQEIEAELLSPPALSGELRLAASSTLANYLLPAVLAGFQSEWPKVRLVLASGNTRQVAQWVREQTVPLGFVEGPCALPGLKVQRLAQDELVVVRGRRFAALRTPFSVAELLSLPMVMREAGSGTREALEAALRAAVPGKLPQVAMQLGSTEAVKTAVELGIGLAAVSRWSVEKELRLGTLLAVEVQGLALRRQLFTLYPQGPAPGGVAGQFLAFLRRALRARRLARTGV